MSLAKTRFVTILFTLLLAGLVVSACSPQPAQNNTPVSGNSGAGASITDPNKSPCIGAQPDPNEKIPTDGTTKTWAKPEQVTLSDKVYCMILTTEHGRIVAELYPQVAPQNVNSIVFLAKQGFYEGITFHRVIPGFMAQTGDPTGTGAGSAGYGVPLEISPLLKYDREGRIGMARTNDPNSAAGQFFITFGPTANLDNGYTIIGQVVEGMNIVKQIKIRNVDQDPNLPPGEKLVSVRIVALNK